MPKVPSTKLLESRARYADEQRALAEVHRGRYFTPPRLSDTSPETSPEHRQSPIQPDSSSSSYNYPEGYIPPTPGRFLEEEEEATMSSDHQMEIETNPTTSGKHGNSDPINGGTSAKRARPGAPSNKKLPGSAKSGSLEGSGDRSVIYLERPLNSVNFVITKFSKQHKFLTFGIASKIISQLIAASEAPVIPSYTQYFLTTALAEVPVHKLCLYLNQSEYDLLPHGAEVLEINVSVVQRNALLSFQTNASTTSLATLNQNKNGVYSIGLNKTNYGLNRHYKAFNTTEPMIPTEVEPPLYDVSASPAYEGLIEDFYGVDNTDSKFSTSLPKHQTGMYTTLKNYFCMTQTNQYVGGWPNLQSKITEYDAAALVGEPILHYKYNPKIAPIKPVQTYLKTQLPFGDLSVLHGTVKSDFEIYKYAMNGSTISYTQNSRNVIPESRFGLMQDIEKSQYMAKGSGGNVSPIMQPSLHIGINPVPALTTNSIISGDTNSNFTDTRSYFDVHCELIVGVKQYTDRPYATQYNCAFGEQYYEIGSGDGLPNSNAVPLGTLYPIETVKEA